MAKQSVIRRVTSVMQGFLDSAVARVAELQRPGVDVTMVREPSKQDIYLDWQGYEKPSGIPVAPPVGYVQQPSLSERIREMVRGHNLAEEVRAAGFETFEEADDFDVGDDYEPSSPYEEVFEGDYDPGAGKKRMDAIEAEEKAKNDKIKADERAALRAEIEKELKAPKSE